MTLCDTSFLLFHLFYSPVRPRADLGRFDRTLVIFVRYEADLKAGLSFICSHGCTQEAPSCLQGFWHPEVLIESSLVSFIIASFTRGSPMHHVRSQGCAKTSLKTTLTLVYPRAWRAAYSTSVTGIRASSDSNSNPKARPPKVFMGANTAGALLAHVLRSTPFRYRTFSPQV